MMLSPIPNSRFVAVLDAAVLYPEALRDTLLRLADVGFFRPHWSDIILEEVRRNLVADGRVTLQGADRHILAAAVSIGATHIVTTNLVDFPPSTVEHLAIKAISPDQFLVEMWEQGPEAEAEIVRILIEQADDLRHPPVTPARLLEHLSIHAPTLANSVRRSLELP
jgi:hypothetical protein